MLKVYVRIIFIILLFINSSLKLVAQNVGINTTAANPSPNAILDLNSGNSNNLGLIIPNVSLTALNIFNPPIANAATAGDVGMIVYNTNVSVGSGVGYYCWEGTVIGWVSVTGSAGNTNACGTAAAGYFPYFTSSTTICNSILYQGSSTTVGVGTNTPKNMLDIKGAVAAGSYAGTNTAPVGTSMIVPQQVGIGTNSPNASALLDLTSTTQGLLTPRMSTAQITSIASPAIGLVLYNTSTGCFEYNYTGTNTGWVSISGITGTLSPASLSFCYASSPTDLITISGLGTYTTIVWSAPATICSPAVVTTANTTNATSLTLSGGTGGTGVVTATITNGCGNMVISTSTITYASSTITQDNTGASGDNVNNFSITTHNANELVVVACDGYTTTSFTGSVAITGAWTGAATLYTTKLNTDCETVIYWFLAPTAGTYTVTTTETGYTDYANFGVALTGFCAAPGSSDFIASNSTTSTGCLCTSMSTTLAETAGSYAIGSYTAYNNAARAAPTWTNLTAISGTDDNKDNYGFAGLAIGTAGTSTITGTQVGNIKDGVFVLMDIQ